MDKDDNYFYLFNYALKLLSFRPRSYQELKKKLVNYSKKKDISNQIIESVIADLGRRNLVNDEAFVKWWIEQRHGYKPKGRKIIEAELLAKGIKKDLIIKLINEKSNPNEEYELAYSIAKKKISNYRRLSLIDRKIKISNLLHRKGFEWEIIYRVIDSLVEKS